MASLAIDQNILVNYARPKLDQAKKYINQARSQAKGFNIPSSFYYRKYLQNLASNLLTIENNVGQTKTKINTSINSFNSIERKTTAKTSRISSLINNLNLTVSVSSTGANVSKNVKSNTKSESLLAKVKSAGKDFVKMLKDTGAKVANGAKSLWNDAKKVAKKAFDFQADLLLTAGTALATPFTSLWDLGKGLFTGDWNFETTKGLWDSAYSLIEAEDTFKRVGASIANGFIALTKGLAHLGEALLKFLDIFYSAQRTLNTGFIDIIRGLTTGNWDWKVTKQLWDRTKARVSYNYVDKAFDWFYNTEIGKTLDEYAYEPFKSDGVGCQILDGVGYATGIIVVSILTFGAATPGFLAITATASGIGKYTSEEWDKNTISLNYNGGDLDVQIDYEKYLQIENLKEGESTTISHTVLLEDGTTQELKFKITGNGNGSYQVVDMNGNIVEFNELKESSTVKGLGIGTIKGGWEGLQYYIGGKIGTGSFSWLTKLVNNPVGKTLLRSGTRVVLDTITGAVEVPFQSLVTMLSEGVSWDEAWKKSGGWNAVKTQSIIAGMMSFGGESLDIGKIKLKAAKTNTSFSDMLKITELEEAIARNKIKYQKMYDDATDSVKRAIDFSNTKQLSPSELEMYHKINDFNMSYYDDEIKLEGLRRTIGKGNVGKYTYKVENSKLQKQFDKLFNEFDKETGEQLEKIFFQEDYVIGIHRSGGELGDTIVGDGLMLTGHASSAVDPNSYSLDLNNNISLINGKTDQDYYNFLLQMKKGFAYKSNGQADIIITAIPKNDINNLSKLISSNDGKFTLKNDYILGYVNNNNGYFSEFKFNSDSINFKNNKNLNISNANVMSSSEFRLKKLLEQYDSQTETILKYEKSGMYTPEQINNFKKSANEIKVEIDELTIEMNKKVESAIVDNINESNNRFWFSEINKANRLHAANDLRATVITVDSLDEIPFDFISGVKSNDSLIIKIGDRFYKPNDVNLMIHNHISNMNSGIVNYTKQFDYWSKQLEIKRNEYSELYDIIKSDEYKMAMEYKNKGYAQDLSWLEYYESVEKKLNDTRSQLQSLSKTCEELDNLAYNERLVAKQAEIESLQDVKKLDDYFSNFGSSKNNNYGVNQGVMQELYKYKVSDGVNDSFYVSAKQYEQNPSLYSNFKVQKEGSLEYFRIKDKLTDVYGFSPIDASRIISGLDSKGACSYAAMSNAIITKFKNHSDIFEQQFGYSLFTKINGKTQLNSAELIMDLYVFANSVENGGKLFQNGRVLAIDNNLDWAGRTMMSAEDQMYMSTSAGANDAMMTLFLRSKGFDNAEFETSILANYTNREMSGKHVSSEPQEIEWIKEDISQKLSEGQSISMGIYKNKMGEIRFIPDDGSKIYSTNNWNEGGGHAVFVTGVSDDGIIVSSWGKRYTIPNRDLLDGSFMIRCSEIYQSN